MERPQLPNSIGKKNLKAVSRQEVTRSVASGPRNRFNPKSSSREVLSAQTVDATRL
jgi:hypothetical protein